MPDTWHFWQVKVARLWSYWVDFWRISEPRIMDNISQNFAILYMIVSVWSLQICICLYFSQNCTLSKIKASVQDIFWFPMYVYVFVCSVHMHVITCLTTVNIWKLQLYRYASFLKELIISHIFHYIQKSIIYKNIKKYICVILT